MFLFSHVDGKLMSYDWYDMLCVRKWGGKGRRRRASKGKCSNV